MDRQLAETLIRQYFQSWLEQDLELFLSTLHTLVKVTECYGPVYCGANEVRQWFTEWHNGNGHGQVTKWSALNIFYDETQKTATVEWDFECVYAGNRAGFLGVSLVHFENGKIISVREYQMEKELYRPFEISKMPSEN